MANSEPSSDVPDAGASKLVEFTVVVVLVPPNRAAHENELRAITRDPNVMKWVANGQVWSEAKLQRFFQYCEEEEHQGPSERKNYYHAVTVNGTCVGVVGIHPVRYDPGSTTLSALTIFLSSGILGRGVGTRVVQAALQAYDAIYPDIGVVIDIRASNSPMKRVAEKVGFVHTKSLEISGRDYCRYERPRLSTVDRL